MADKKSENGKCVCVLREFMAHSYILFMLEQFYAILELCNAIFTTPSGDVWLFSFFRQITLHLVCHLAKKKKKESDKNDIINGINY